MSGSGSVGSIAMAGQQALRQAKQSLRKQMAIQLNALNPTFIASQSSQITRLILEHPSYKAANNISIYVSMEKGEVRTEELCKETLLSGKKLYVPRFAASKTKSGNEAKFDLDMRMLRVSSWKDFESMIMNKWGIREPEDMVDAAKREDG